jgi:hypothetical protein
MCTLSSIHVIFLIGPLVPSRRHGISAKSPESAQLRKLRGVRFTWGWIVNKDTPRRFDDIWCKRPARSSGKRSWLLELRPSAARQCQKSYAYQRKCDRAYRF